ncbi:MAG: BCD family MFS transporter, partial [Chloroflexota bacterium]
MAEINIQGEFIPEAETFSWWRMMRLSSFQIGSAMGDILVTSIWNRVMISNFGMPAWPIGLLIALRYFLSPLSLWAGHRSDTTKLFGFYRSSYIWFGRGMMVISLPFLLLSLQRLDGQTTDPLGWVYAILCFILYGTGSLLSGSPYLALVRDSAPKVNQGFAISVAETVLIIFFAVSGISFSFWMEEYDPAIFRQMVIFTMVVGGFFWFVGILGIERESVPPAVKDKSSHARQQIQFSPTLKKIWADPRTRLFFLFLSLSTLAAWMQDVILEPFGGDVLDAPMSATTRYNSYWQTATVVTLIGGAAYLRKRAPETQKGVAGWGLSIMALGMALIGLESFLSGARLIEAGLLVFGAG